MKEQFEMLASYNAWANKLLYAAVSEMSPDQILADRGAFFSSIHGTLNHILVGDQLWLRRIEGAGPQPESLDTVLFEDFPSLGVARKIEDARIRRIVGKVSGQDLNNDLTYKSVAGDQFTMPLWQVWTHLFNHQTHHRGQVHSMLTQAGMASPEIDFIYYLRLMQPIADQ